MAVFWNVSPRSLQDVHGCLSGVYCFHHQKDETDIYDIFTSCRYFYDNLIWRRLVGFNTNTEIHDVVVTTVASYLRNHR
jgi:hypothetical protein